MQTTFEELKDAAGVDRAGRSVAGLAAAVGVAALTAAVSIPVSPSPRNPDQLAWYERLDKPSFNPPKPVFPIVWGTLDLLTALSGWTLWNAKQSSERDAALGLWGAHMGLKGLWTFLFFGRRAVRLSVPVAVAEAGVAIGYAVLAHKVRPLAAVLALPLVGWLAFAAVLNADVARRNRESPA